MIAEGIFLGLIIIAFIALIGLIAEFLKGENNEI